MPSIQKSAGILPGVVRKRHCPVMGSYSWFSSEHRHRKEPSTFSQRASPHTPLSISHSFTSGWKGRNINQFKAATDSLFFYLLYLCQWCLPDFRYDLWGRIKTSLIPKWAHKQVVWPFEIKVHESHNAVYKKIGAVWGLLVDWNTSFLLFLFLGGCFFISKYFLSTIFLGFKIESHFICILKRATTTKLVLFIIKLPVNAGSEISGAIQTALWKDSLLFVSETHFSSEHPLNNEFSACTSTACVLYLCEFSEAALQPTRVIFLHKFPLPPSDAPN